MADEWLEAQLTDLAVDRDRAFAMGPFGSNIRAENYQDSGVPVIRGTNLGQPGEPRFRSYEYVYLSEAKADDLASSNVHANDIVFVAQGTVGKVGIIPRDTGHRRFVLSQNLMKVTIDLNRADPLYVFYFFRSSLGQHEILSRVNPTGVPCISKPLTSLREFSVRLPRNLVTQRAIACILGALDDKIELNRRMNRTLEATAQAIFKSWFVDFDPVRAKAAGQNPSGLKPQIAALFPASFQESDLGEIPKGWTIGKIEDIASINACTLGRRDAFDVIDYIEINEVMRGEVGTITRYAHGEEPSRARRRLKHGDTVLSTVRPDRGAYFLVLNPPESLIASTGFAVLTPKDVNWAFLHAATTRPEFGQELGRLADGGAYPAIRPEVVGGRDLVLPNDSKLIAAFDKLSQPLFLRAELNRNECRALAATRDALLPKLICGDLRMPAAERIAGRCV